jgi:Rod binding domain-containing protein
MNISSVPPTMPGKVDPLKPDPLSQVDPKEKQKLWDASKALEQVFAGYLLNEVGKKLPGTPEGSNGSSIYADMLKDALSKQMTESGEGMGLAKTLYFASAKMLHKTETDATKADSIKMTLPHIKHE